MPRSAPRSTTLPSEVTMQPKATLVTFRPVLPRARYSNLMSEARLAGACDWGLAERDADAIAGNPIPATRKLRREESMVPPGLTPFPGVNILIVPNRSSQRRPIASGRDRLGRIREWRRHRGTARGGLHTNRFGIRVRPT